MATGQFLIGDNWVSIVPIFPSWIVTCTGAQVVAKMTCTQGHQSNWSSCTNVGEKKTSAASINVDLTASIFLSGLRFERVKVSLRNIRIIGPIFAFQEFFALMSIQFISRFTFYNVRPRAVVPACIGRFPIIPLNRHASISHSCFF